ncbi:MAG: GuaA, partial [Deltaproteobacteria bacterium]|nr:GuaA [Deltaproteobacteria bacterium]
MFNKYEENTCLLTARLLAQRLLFYDTMNVLIVKHVDIEGPGLIEHCLNQRGKHVLGICLGAQLIAKALGARVTKSPVKEIGWSEVSLTEEGLKDPLFSALPKAFPVFQWHEDTFEIP